MGKTLILTGWGYHSYAFAAAMVLKRYPQADILGMSRRHLPEYLEEVNGYDEIIILGISLMGDAERLAKALKLLKQNGIKVVWLSSIDFPESIGDDVRSNLESLVDGDDVTDAVGTKYGLDLHDFMELWDENTSIGQKYGEFIEAAGYFHRNYQDDLAYPRVIRHIAAKDDEKKWTDSERQMIMHYRRYGHHELVGNSHAMTDLKEKINRIAVHDHARVLILGESGTGKETVAEQLHNKSGRKEEPFIAFNCASVSPTLLESRFLGHRKGAFTGADEDRAGLFETANGGTLFLDEIGELPLEAQGLLLRVLEGGRFLRLGETKNETEVDVRIIAATNRDLPAMVRDGKFREDLFQRLSVIQLRMPPLREHKEDIPAITRNFRKLNKMAGQLSNAQCEVLMEYDFPGNVRELFNLLERADVMNITDYKQLIREHIDMNASLRPKAEEEIPDNLEEAIRLHVVHVCEKYCNNITKAANALGISRNTVRKYLE